MVPLGEPMVPLGDPMLPLGDPMLPLGEPMLPLGDPMLPLAGAARREHNSSFPKNSSISPIETSFVKLCSRRAGVPSMTGTK